ncbi:MAG TPA: TrpR-related protein YerC/YecD [Candidatus Anaerofilum faecale]|nr:YerC/YecD family TrpR-related protein [Anaerofilum sp. An201]OUP03915.1 TrpR-related protein YerC/YecD [Anaerofilum sp. An201]HIX13032.1 TrpR-related protein YerC/YecD [Candidatus Anaerofilum faecale]
MTERIKRPAETTRLFQAVLALKNEEECAAFFADLCTMKELADMSQRLQAAEMLLEGKTYEQIVKNAEISTATISRINHCIQYGNGGYRTVLGRLAAKRR